MKLTEAQFQQQVVDLATLKGWRVFHTPDSRRTNAGWPDLAMIRRGDLILAELKSESGPIRGEQRQVLLELTPTPCTTTHLWRPSDWDTIERRLNTCMNPTS